MLMHRSHRQTLFDLLFRQIRPLMFLVLGTFAVVCFFSVALMVEPGSTSLRRRLVFDFTDDYILEFARITGLGKRKADGNVYYRNVWPDNCMYQYDGTVVDESGSDSSSFIRWKFLNGTIHFV